MIRQVQHTTIRRRTEDTAILSIRKGVHWVFTILALAVCNVEFVAGSSSPNLASSPALSSLSEAIIYPPPPPPPPPPQGESELLSRSKSDAAAAAYGPAVDNDIESSNGSQVFAQQENQRPLQPRPPPPPPPSLKMNNDKEVVKDIGLASSQPATFNDDHVPVTPEHTRTTMDEQKMGQVLHVDKQTISHSSFVDKAGLSGDGMKKIMDVEEVDLKQINDDVERQECTQLRESYPSETVRVTEDWQQQHAAPQPSLQIDSASSNEVPAQENDATAPLTSQDQSQSLQLCGERLRPDKTITLEQQDSTTMLIGGDEFHRERQTMVQLKNRETQQYASREQYYQQQSFGTTDNEQYAGRPQQQQPAPLSQWFAPHGDPSRQMVISRQPRFRGTQQPPPVWTRLWKKVETGLDSLAVLEDGLQHRAQKLVQTTVATVRKGKPHKIINRVGEHAQQQQPQTQRQPPAVFDIAAVQKNRYQQKVAGNEPSPVQTGAGELPNIKTGAAGPKRRMIIANGGSSAPTEVAAQQQGQQQQHSLLQRQTQQEGQLPVAKGTRPMPADSHTEQPLPQAVKSSPFVAARNVQQQQQSATTQEHMVLSVSHNEPVKDDIVDTNVKPSITVQHPPQRYAFEDDESSRYGLSRFQKMLSAIPRPHFPRLFNKGGSFRRDDALAALDLWKAADEDDRPTGFFSNIFGKGRRKEPKDDYLSFSAKGGPAKIIAVKNKIDSTTPQLLDDFMQRCHNGKNNCLLTTDDRRRGGSIGRTLATLDLVAICAVMVAVREIRWDGLVMPLSWSQLASESLPAFLAVLIQSMMNGWLPIALAVIYLASKTIELVQASSVNSLCDDISTSLSNEARTASLFLRLYMGMPVDRQLANRLQDAGHVQFLEKGSVARLRFFVFSLLATLVAMAVSLHQSLAEVAVSAFSSLLTFNELHLLPVLWKALFANAKESWSGYATTIGSLLKQTFQSVTDNPVKAAYQFAVFSVLVVAAYLPRFERLRKPTVAPSGGDDEDTEAVQLHSRLTESLEDLGSSSGTRLCALSEMSAIEAGLERWRLMLPQDFGSGIFVSNSSLVRVILYHILSGMIIFAPVLLLAYKGITPFGSSEQSRIQWDSIRDVSIVLLYTHHLTSKALSDAVVAKDAEGHIAAFIETVSKAVQCRVHEKEAQPSLELQAAINPNAGLEVRDLWAAHTIRRAWAVRGATFEVSSSEIVLLLGEGGAGKTRLLTTLAEAVLDPPREALSTTRVRGTISVCGVEAKGKHPPSRVRRRLGLLLNDVQTLSAVSKAMSGMSIEEILEPSSNKKSFNAAQNAMVLGLKITGLYSSLIPRFPSKLSTIVTAMEEDLQPSSLRPRSALLSPNEWSKLLLARVLAQAIYDNDNPASSGDNVDRCLVGSILLLDDATAHLSEVEEARLFRELRRTGAAVVIASNRWATGRFADRVMVLKDGGIIEHGTHNQLLGRGPQYSLYSAQWNVMATS